MKKGLMLGSSIFEQWQSAEGVYKGFELKNRSIGGTTAAFWATEIAFLLGQDEADFVMLYCGSNDFNQGLSKEAVLNTLRTCTEQIRQNLGLQALVYCSIMKAPQKIALGLSEDIDYVNQAVTSFLYPSELVIDMNEAIAAYDVVSATDSYLEDGLHLSEAAYCKISKYVFPRLESWIQRGS